MIPPRTGPRMPDIAMMAPAKAPIILDIRGDAISVRITKPTEYKPEPPTPCSVRMAISWSRLLLKPHPSEKARKITNAAT